MGALRGIALCWLLLVSLAAPAWADARLSVLIDVLQLRETVEILHREEQEHAASLEADLLGGKGGAAWQSQVDALLNPERVMETVRHALAAELTPEQIETVIAFYGTSPGDRIITLENAARAAIADPQVEQSARDRYLELAETAHPRLALLRRIVKANAMIDRNVTSAMNASLHFLRGMTDGQAYDMTEEEMLESVTGQVEAITADTTAWLYGYMLLAYHPLDPAALEQYVVFSESPAGRALNRALFDGFGRAYEETSYGLGRLVALNMAARDL